MAPRFTPCSNVARLTPDIAPCNVCAIKAGSAKIFLEEDSIISVIAFTALNCISRATSLKETVTSCGEPDELDPRVDALVTELIGRVADKWTMLILEVLVENGELR